MTIYATAVYNGTTYNLYGFPGSTLRDELNRLANGGEYPPYTEYKDETGAVNIVFLLQHDAVDALQLISSFQILYQ